MSVLLSVFLADSVFSVADLSMTWLLLLWGMILLLWPMRNGVLALEIWLMVWLIKLRMDAVESEDDSVAVVESDRLLSRSDFLNLLRDDAMGGLGSSGFLIVG